MSQLDNVQAAAGTEWMASKCLRQGVVVRALARGGAILPGACMLTDKRIATPR